MGQALAIASVVSTVVGTVSKAQGQKAAGKAQAENARFRAGVARNNKILADRASADATLRGESDARLQEQRTRQLIGRQRAILAANGIVVDQDSALDITEDTASIGAMDAETIRRNAAREALNFDAQGANFVAQSQLLENEGNSSASAGRRESFGTVLGGIGSVATKWKSFSDLGVSGFST